MTELGSLGGVRALDGDQDDADVSAVVVLMYSWLVMYFSSKYVLKFGHVLLLSGLASYSIIADLVKYALLYITATAAVTCSSAPNVTMLRALHRVTNVSIILK